MSATEWIVSAKQRWQGWANSPTWLRDASTVTSPLRLGTWFLMLNILIVVSLVMVYLMVIGRMQSTGRTAEALAAMGLGRLFAGTILLALTFFLTVFVPIRVFGVFLGPRTGRYFDQIVLSGITPWRFLIGKVLGQQAFFVIMLVVCLPYLLLCLSFGAVSLWEVILCMGLLFVYVHVLVVAFLVASTLMSELVALPVIIAGFLFSAVFGLLALSPNPISLTPTGPILGMLYQDLAQPETFTFRQGFAGLTLVQSHVAFYGMASILMLGLGGLAVALGPISALSPGLSTFGEVVLPGDRKRSSWLKRRFNLRRHAELSFLYENGSLEWRAKDFRRRWFLRETVFVLLIGAALIWIYWLLPPYGVRMYALLEVLCLAALLLNAVLFADPWIAERLHGQRWEAGALNTLCFLFNSFLVWLGFGWLPEFLGLDLTPLQPYYPRFETFGHLGIQEANRIVVTQFVLTVGAYYAMLRWAILGKHSKGVAALIALFVFLILSYMPIWVDMLRNGNRVEGPDVWPWMTMGNLVTFVDMLLNGRSLSYETGVVGMWWATGLWFFVMVFFAVLAWKRRQLLPRRAL